MSADASPAPGLPRAPASAIQITKMKLSSSLLPNNLQYGSKYYAYIHRNEVHVFDGKLIALGSDKIEPVKSPYNEKDPVNQIEFVKISGLGEVMVILNQGGGVFIYDDSGQKMIHSYKHNKTLKEQHLRGIATDGKDALYVGTGTGDLLVFSISKSKFALSKVISDVHNESAVHGGGISALCYSTKDSTLISADDWGNVVFWAGAGDAIAANKTTKLDGKGAPVNCFSYGHGWLVSGSTDGAIRIYDVAKKSMVVEIGAHTRAINSIDIHHNKPMILAVSEDTYVSCWSFPASATSFSGVQNIMMACPSNSLLTGGKFAGGSDQKYIICTIYDSRALAFLNTP